MGGDAVENKMRVQIASLDGDLQERDKTIAQLHQQLNEVLVNRTQTIVAPLNVPDEMVSRGPQVLAIHFKKSFEEAIGALAAIETLAIGTGIPGAVELSTSVPLCHKS